MPFSSLPTVEQDKVKVEPAIVIDMNRAIREKSNYLSLGPWEQFCSKPLQSQILGRIISACL